jgi:dipeptidyl aminopeptidase/acylaminoacyl peptidase
MAFTWKLKNSVRQFCVRAMAIGISLSLGTALAVAQSGRPEPMAPLRQHDARVGELLQMLGKVRTPAAAAISPDGRYVAWTVRGGSGNELHITGLAPEGSAQDAAWERVVSPDTVSNVTNNRGGVCSASSPAWSPDGKKLAFLSGCEQMNGNWVSREQSQIFVWTLADNGIKQLTKVTGGIDAPVWSPDGKTIAFLFVENATRSAGALAAMKPWSGVVGEDGVEVQRIFAISLESGRGGFVTDASLHVYEFSFNPSHQPDSRLVSSEQITFVAAEPPGENNWWKARLYTKRIEERNCVDGDVSCQTAPLLETQTKMIFDPVTASGPLHGMQIALPRFSPDGGRIAFIGGLMSDQGATGGDIWVVPATGGEAKNLTPSRPSTPAYFGWINDKTLGISEHAGGSSRIVIHHIDTGEDDPEKAIMFPESIGSGSSVMSISAADNGDIAIIRSSFDRSPEVWAGPMLKLRQITHLNDSIKPMWGKTENIEWTNDGFKVQGWLLYPINYDPAKKYPLVVSVHGGPSSAVSPRWPAVGYNGASFAALGYFVFMPNPRGSYGQGERFTQANRKDFGYGDLRDILAGMDVLEKRFPIDKNREGLTGWSYGGFMTMFGVTQTNRFKAAVAGAGISDWKSYYGENSIDQWMVPFFGATVYDDPAAYAKSSAIEFIKNVKTPTLVVVGDRDGECPAPQSFEFWHALRAEGVKTQLVVYPNEGHAFRDADHRRDVMERALNWFETEMPVSGK